MEMIIAIVASVVVALVLGVPLLKARTQNAVAQEQLRQEQNAAEERANKASEEISALQIQLREQQAHKEKIAGLEAELTAQHKRADERDEELDKVHTEISNLRKMKEQNAQTITALEKDLENAKEREVFVAEANKLMSSEFKTLAQGILAEKEKSLDVSSAKLLEPFFKELETFRNSVNKVHNEESAKHATLRAELNLHIAAMQGNATKLSGDARELVLALKGDSKMLGDWGEITLERLLEDSGLRKDVEYETQKTLRDDDKTLRDDDDADKSKSKRLDVLVRLPDNRHLIIDSKLSLSAYKAAANADNDATQKQLLNQHVDAVRLHINELSQKHYPDLKGLNAPDFVFLFMPIEPAFLAALKSDPDLYKYAYDKKIILTAPTTLMGVMKIVEHICRKPANTCTTRPNDYRQIFAGAALYALARFVRRALAQL